MSRKNRKPRFTLSQEEAERLITAVKNAVEDVFRMPAAGEHNAEFHVRADDGEKFTIAVFQGTKNAASIRYQPHHETGNSADTPMRQQRTHNNPDGTRISVLTGMYTRRETMIWWRIRPISSPMDSWTLP